MEFVLDRISEKLSFIAEDKEDMDILENIIQYIASGDSVYFTDMANTDKETYFVILQHKEE